MRMLNVRGGCQMDTINVAGSDAQPQAPVAGMEQDFWWQQETNDPIQEPPDA